MDYYEELNKLIDDYVEQCNEIMNSLDRILKDDANGESKEN